MCVKASCHLYARLVDGFFKPVYQSCCPSSCVVFSVLPDAGVPFGGMTATAQETLVQGCVRDGLSEVVISTAGVSFQRAFFPSSVSTQFLLLGCQRKQPF